MMKTLLVVVAAVASLAGCVGVPVYSEPAPPYGYYYAPPVTTFSFGFNSYGSGHGHGARHGHGGRHGHRR
jgi:hypothetical protein